MTLPCITLGDRYRGGAGALSRDTASQRACTAISSSPPAQRASRRGVSCSQHVLRNAVIPAVTALGIQFGRLIGGAVLTEAVFNLPGLGTLLWTALVQRDYFVIQAVTLLAVAAVHPRQPRNGYRLRRDRSTHPRRGRDDVSITQAHLARAFWCS